MGFWGIVGLLHRVCLRHVVILLRLIAHLNISLSKEWHYRIVRDIDLFYLWLIRMRHAVILNSAGSWTAAERLKKLLFHRGLRDREAFGVACFSEVLQSKFKERLASLKAIIPLKEDLQLFECRILIIDALNLSVSAKRYPLLLEGGTSAIIELYLHAIEVAHASIVGVEVCRRSYRKSL